ncbi:hypothetical protein CC1G_00853 [Coprinopsis cinerea okayama7|uniref:Transcription factor BYE1 n=1 Tax=Coprinopsis cinerea (strain Okayama-7 / 130 / ATCC MYA-4618 / FGSC 9003) TaxID=240176 RepID=A8N8X8_COPC7|nr:hypothetical protein CC1G_00853 [Coprinopsis cinerea okayama7\|eukprot:XP_001831306.1 hypothetical protein CC1G_00853 [Coprinopsis cinerea okayama7\
MATRSKAKAAASATGKKAAQQSSKRAKTETSSSARASEERSVNGRRKPSKTAPAKRAKPKPDASVKEEYCTCSKGDDGSPMVVCGQCKIWYHFVCVDLAEKDAEDICFYVCPTCTTSTGLRTTRSWEGRVAFDDPNEAAISKGPVAPSKRKTSKPPVAKKPMSDESDNEVSSEDDFVMEEEEKKPQVAQAKRRRTAVASDTDTDTSDSDAHIKRKRRLRRVSASPAPNTMKRKASVSQAPTPVKRSKSTPPQEDPTRKYCLGKLQELFRDIFFRYPHIQTPEGTLVAKAVDEMTEEEKDALTQEANQFAHDLEMCIFEIYAEPDKNGNPNAGMKYKDRFRTLQFNLSKHDRVVIHQRITSRNIAPKELSQMSSTDLANEETKQLIKVAEKEALEHSILPQITAPRAKITHKGIEDIEVDDDDPSTSTLDYEQDQKERERVAEERRERERMARLRGVQRQRTASMSVPPESPTVLQTPTSDSWGAPPPVPAHAQSPVQESGGQSALPPLALAGSEIRYTPEPELNLSDLINIDEEATPSSEAVPTPPTTSTQGDQATRVDPFSRPIITVPSSSSDPPTDESPSVTAVPPEKPGFNLSTLWTTNATDKEKDADMDDNDDGEPMAISPPPLSPPALHDDDDKDILAEGGDNMDGPEPDFDALFQEQPPEPPRPQVPVSVEQIPQVWTGKLSMPLDSSIPQDTPMVARQVAGTTIEPESLLWKTLFPSDHLGIGGRVPIANSSDYLTQMRLNPTKELYAVAFAPASEQDEASFQALSDFLVAKGRHGLIFPWGQRPKEHHPGKELYIIPLKASEPIPEYMELLDNLKIPKERKRNYLIGIWVLNKGKLAPPPPPPPVAAPVSMTLSVAHQPTPPTVPAAPVNVTATPPHIPPIASPAIPLGSSTPLGVPPTPVNPILPINGPLPPGVDPVALAAEVASLTPEQLQLLRSLAGSAIPVPSQPPQQAPAAVPVPPAFPPYPPPPAVPTMPPDHLRHTWQGSASPYTPPQYQGYGDHGAANHASQPHRPPPPPHNYPNDRYDAHGHHQGHGDREHHRGGWRGKNKSRGHWDRNQGHRDQQHRDNYRPVDSGWPRKQHGAGEQSYGHGRQW